jgi:hypothetical protein
LFREQHDFPGLRRLDRAFSQAVHAEEHQHIVWSTIAVQSTALLMLVPIILLLVVVLFRFRDFVPAALWYPFLGVLALFAAAGVIMALLAVVRYGRREALFHRNIGNKVPAVFDYPVRGTYTIQGREAININLSTAQSGRPQVRQQSGSLVVTLTPEPGQWEDHHTFRQRYPQEYVGQYVHGGVVALENVGNVQFQNDVLEFGHRLVLRNPATEVIPAEPGAAIRPLQVQTYYELSAHALYPQHNGLEQFPLRIEPRLAPDDSRTLRLRLQWHGPNTAALCRLEECILKIPDKLGDVTRVTLGRFDKERQQVIWRNRAFKEQGLELRITFEQPILQCDEWLRGTYSFVYEDLLSGITIRPEHVWTVLGTPAGTDKVEVSCQTMVQGYITLNMQQLSQEHEHVRSMEPIICQAPPDETMVQCVTAVLLEEGFDLQRITRTAPRLDPTGRLDKQLFYWDIVGRKYNEELLDSLDIHVVITGSDRMNGTGVVDDIFQPSTNIDLRIRCLSDPRNTKTPASMDTLLAAGTEYSLAAKIRKRIGASCK